MSFVERLGGIYKRGESGLVGSRTAFRLEGLLLNTFINLFELRDGLLKTLDRESSESARIVIPLLSNGTEVVVNKKTRKLENVEDPRTVKLREREGKVISAVGTAGRMGSLVRQSELPDSMRDLAYLEGMLFVSIIESVISERVREYGMKYLRSWAGWEDLLELREKIDKGQVGSFGQTNF